MSEMQPVPAATVVLIREAQSELEVLLLRRNSKLVFHGGHWVFPGGRIDQSDFSDADEGLEYPAALRAAVRETREEAGIELEAERLIHTAHWTTPPKLPRRFSTWFFICPITEPVAVTVDNDEILEHRWISPKAALEQASRELIVLPRPTAVTLQGLQQHTSMDQLHAELAQGKIHVFPEDSSYYRPAEMGCP